MRKTEKRKKEIKKKKKRKERLEGGTQVKREMTIIKSRGKEGGRERRKGREGKEGLTVS